MKTALADRLAELSHESTTLPASLGARS